MIPPDIEQEIREILVKSRHWDEAAILGLLPHLDKLLNKKVKLIDYFYPGVTYEDLLCETHLLQIYYESRDSNTSR